jgi:hypothetical protein
MSIHYYSCINDSPHTLIMELNMQAYFDQLDRVRYEGPKTTNPLAFRHYNPDELVLGKRMEDHLRFAACYWHTFCWNGADMFGVGSFDRPWQQPGEAIELAERAVLLLPRCGRLAGRCVSERVPEQFRADGGCAGGKTAAKRREAAVGHRKLLH